MEQHKRKLTGLISTVLVLLLPLIGFWQRWNIYDAWRLNGYAPSTQVVTLADETSVNETGRKLFYVNHPKLETKTEFRQNCPTGEQTIVLGCFVPFQGIYLQNIDDQRLAGVMQVTAAHEMLHAAYQRLSMSEKKRVGALLDAEFAKLKDERIKNTIEDYKKAGADISNELHSILATEVRELSPELETYYKRYFTDRYKVVAFSEHYEAAFTSRKAQVAEYDKQLASIKQQIDNLTAELDTDEQALNAKQEEMNKLAKANNIQQYNAQVPVFNAMVQAYNNKVSRVRSLIDTYNDIVKKRNDIALEESELVKAIDSRPDTVKTE